MSRLTEQELVLINQARRDRRRDEAEQQRHWREARRPQDKDMVGLIGQAMGFVTRVTGLRLLARGVIAPLQAAWQRRATLDRLSRLNDHMLDDIGLDRGTIHDFAEGTQERPAASPLVARIRAYRQRRATIRELEALDDRMLADIGLVRGQIPAVVKQAMGNNAEDGPALRAKALIDQLDQKARSGPRANIDRQTARRMAEVGPTRISKSGYVETPRALAS